MRLATFHCLSEKFPAVFKVEGHYKAIRDPGEHVVVIVEKEHHHQMNKIGLRFLCTSREDHSEFSIFLQKQVCR